MPGAILTPIAGVTPQFRSREVSELFRRELTAGGNAIVAKLREYPPQTVGKKHKFTSDRERRYVMWAIRTGKIRIPYPRTERLKASWSYLIQGSSDITLLVWSPMRYAGFVQGVRSGGTLQQTKDMQERKWNSIRPLFGRVWQDTMRRIQTQIRSAVQP